MKQPKVVQEKQLVLNFGEKYAEVAHKETERVVKTLLKCFAQLNLSADVVNAIMLAIETGAPEIAAHTEVE